MFQKILHPSDFTETSQVAFGHALRIAIAAHADLRLLHVATPGEHTNKHDFPSVRDVLESWKILAKGSSRREVVNLGIGIDKRIITGRDPVASISEFITKHPLSMVVLAHHARASWLGRSRAETISRTAAATTLFLPDGATGFVSFDTSAIQLRNILVPVAVEPSPVSTFRSVSWLAQAFKLEAVNVHVLHVGSQSTLPATPRNEDGVSFHVHFRSGDVVSNIVAASTELDADLVVMATDGHDGFLDAVRGSTTEQVLRKLTRPLWAISPK